MKVYIVLSVSCDYRDNESLEGIVGVYASKQLAMRRHGPSKGGPCIGNGYRLKEFAVIEALD